MNHRRQLPVSFAFVLVAVLNLNVFSTRVAQLPRSMRDARAREKQTPQHDVGLVETASSLSASQIDLARQAENGDKESQYELATLYQEGRSVEKNYVEAVKWYRRSAEQGWPAAENKLGQMYDRGRGVPLDKTQAVFWYPRAAEQNYPPVRGAPPRGPLRRVPILEGRRVRFTSLGPERSFAVGALPRTQFL